MGASKRQRLGHRWCGLEFGLHHQPQSQSTSDMRWNAMVDFRRRVTARAMRVSDLLQGFKGSVIL